MITLTPAHALSEALVKKYIEHPLADKDVKWCLLEKDRATIDIDTKTQCIWIHTTRILYTGLIEILMARADLGLLFPDQLYHCYCIFVRCNEGEVKIRGGEHCDRYLSE